LEKNAGNKSSPRSYAKIVKIKTEKIAKIRVTKRK
jgi:hypothetical protein